MLKKYGHLGNIVADGKEFNMNSPLVEDTKLKFWMNMHTGAWQDFAARKGGKFIHFIKQTTSKNYSEIEADLLFEIYLNFADDLFEGQDEPEEEQALVTGGAWVPIYPEMELPPNKATEVNWIRKAWMFLYERKLFDVTERLDNTFYAALDGTYAGRLIIPYNGLNDEMFYFQGRTLCGQWPKYKNAKNRKGSHILYPFDERQPYVVVCEGAVDARSLQMHGINATSTLSCKVSFAQLHQLREWGGRIVVGFDNDDAGLDGLLRVETFRRKHCMAPIDYVRPPEPFKDWNEAHIAGVDFGNLVSSFERVTDFTFMDDIERFEALERFRLRNSKE